MLRTPRPPCSTHFQLTGSIVNEFTPHVKGSGVQGVGRGNGQERGAGGLGRVCSTFLGAGCEGAGRPGWGFVPDWRGSARGLRGLRGQVRVFSLALCSRTNDACQVSSGAGLCRGRERPGCAGRGLAEWNRGRAAFVPESRVDKFTSGLSVLGGGVARCGSVLRRRGWPERKTEHSGDVEMYANKLEHTQISHNKRKYVEIRMTQKSLIYLFVLMF